MSEQSFESQVAQPAPRRQKRYGSVRSAIAALKALLRKEDAGLSAFDPAEAAATAGSELPVDYSPQTSHHAPVGELLGALERAQQLSIREYGGDDDEVEPSEIWACWGRYRIWGWSLSEVADWLKGKKADANHPKHELGISREAVRRYRIDRGDGYVESALKEAELWSTTLAREEGEREERAGAGDKDRDYEEAM